MSRFSVKRLARSVQTAKRLAPQNTLSEEQAKLYSNAVRTGWTNNALPTWDGIQAEKQWLDAVSLIEAARVLKLAGMQSEAMQAYRRAGDLLEWLSRSQAQPNETSGEPIPIALLSACAFHLAGYPAMARGLLAERYLPSATGRLFAAFLRADFELTLVRCADYWSRNMDLTGKEGSWGSIQDTDDAAYPGDAADDIEDMSAGFLGAEIVRCIGSLSKSLILDDRKKANLALEKLSGLSEYLTRTARSHSWLALTLTSDVASEYLQGSLWSWVGGIKSAISPSHWDNLNGFVRMQFHEGKGLVWPSQKEGISRLTDSKSFAMCTPTGSGKTTIAELAILRELYSVDRDDSGESISNDASYPLVIYIVPSRALASEVEARLSRDIGAIDDRITITGLYGGTEWNLTSRWLTEPGPTVLICTVEMAEAVLRYVGPILIPRLRLLIIDEAHQVQFNESVEDLSKLRTSENRAARLEQFAARVFTNAPSCRAVALSAVAGGAEKDIARWIGGDSGELPVGMNYRSTRQLIGVLECYENGTSRIYLELVDGKPLKVANRETEAYIPVPFPPMPGLGTKLKNLAPFTRCHTLWAAIQLAHASRIVLISIMQSIEDVISNFRIAFEEKLWVDSIPSFFSPPDNIDTPNGRHRAKLYKDCLAACREYCGENSHEYFLLGRGIAVHHGQLPVRVRRLMTEVIKHAITPVTVGTSTLTEGVNMPFDVIILPSITRSHKVSGDRNDSLPIPVPEFMNLAGRAGRPNAGLEGITLVVLVVEPAANQGTKGYVEQQASIRKNVSAFKSFIQSIVNFSDSQNAANSPLSRLIQVLWQTWQQTYHSFDRSAFLDWLESTAPHSIPDTSEAGRDLANTLDSLDLILISAIEEAEWLQSSPLEGSRLEDFIKKLWSRTYAQFTTSERSWLERIFVTRSFGVSSTVYPDSVERRDIYRLGMPPRRRITFLKTAGVMESYLRNSIGFAGWSWLARYNYIEGLAKLMGDDPWFGLRDAKGRHKKPGTPWADVLKWWLRIPNAQQPLAHQVRQWLFLATHDFEYRLGSAVTSTISAIWNKIHGDDLVVPTLDQWGTETGLPWAAFWLRELLSWGTVEPLVCFLVSSGSCSTREEAEPWVGEYYSWHLEEFPDAKLDDFFHPYHMTQWHRLQFGESLKTEVSSPENLEANLTNPLKLYPLTSMPVIPGSTESGLSWFDPGGYCLAMTSIPAYWSENFAKRFDFFLNPRQRSIVPRPIRSSDRI